VQGKGKLAVVDAMDFLKVIMTHNMIKRYDMEAVAAAKTARMKVAAVTLSTLSQCERFAKVPAPPEGQRMVQETLGDARAVVVQKDALLLPVAATASPSAHGDGPIFGAFGTGPW